MRRFDLVPRLARRLLPLLLLALAACASVGDFGGPYPPSGEYPAPSARQELHGPVRNVDHANRRFLLEDARVGLADIGYDGATRLLYEGRDQAVSGLEPGDRVRVLASREGGLWRAQDIEVLADVRQGGDGTDGMERRGAIARVDPRSRTITITEGGYSGGEQTVGYDSRTQVEYRGRQYPPEALERGDLVRVRLARGERGWVADTVLVEVSARER